MNFAMMSAMLILETKRYDVIVMISMSKRSWPITVILVD